QDALNARIEADLSPAFLQAPQQGVGNGAGAADGDAEAAVRGQQRQHQAQAGSGEVFRAEIDVQGQGRDDAAGGLPLKGAAGEPSRGRETGGGQPQQVPRTKSPRGAETGQRRQERRRKPFAHRALPERQAAPGGAVDAERGGSQVEVAGDADAGAVGGG